MNSFIHPSLYPYFKQYPLQLVDVGASGGIPLHWKIAQKFLHTISFEPDERGFRQLESAGNMASTVLKAALYKEQARMPLYLTRKQEVSSLLPHNREVLDAFPDSGRFDIIGEETIEVDTLDQQLDRAGVADVDFIKIDTQGSELYILQGAGRTLNGAFGIEIEVEFAELYKDQPIFSEVEQFLRSHGFQLFDLHPYYWKRKQGLAFGKEKGQLIFADALFLKDSHSYISWCRNIEDFGVRKAKLLHALVICLIYGYADYAFELFRYMPSGTFTRAEQECIKKFFHRSTLWYYHIPHIKGRGMIVRILRRLAQIIEPHKWITIGSGKQLGNR